MLKPTDVMSRTTTPARTANSHRDGVACPRPRPRMRKAASVAPPPIRADANAMSCEMLVNDPTTSSGEGIANAGVTSRPRLVSARIAVAIVATLERNAAQPSSCIDALTLRLDDRRREIVLRAAFEAKAIERRSTPARPGP